MKITVANNYKTLCGKGNYSVDNASKGSIR